MSFAAFACDALSYASASQAIAANKASRARKEAEWDTVPLPYGRGSLCGVRPSTPVKFALFVDEDRLTEPGT